MRTWRVPRVSEFQARGSFRLPAVPDTSQLNASIAASAEPVCTWFPRPRSLTSNGTEQQSDYTQLLNMARAVVGHSGVEENIPQDALQRASTNRDDHARQHAFSLMDKAGTWSLARPTT